MTPYLRNRCTDCGSENVQLRQCRQCERSVCGNCRDGQTCNVCLTQYGDAPRRLARDTDAMQSTWAGVSIGMGMVLCTILVFLGSTSPLLVVMAVSFAMGGALLVLMVLVAEVQTDCRGDER